MIDRVVRWHCTIDIIAITAGDAGVSSMGHGMHSTGSYANWTFEVRLGDLQRDC